MNTHHSEDLERTGDDEAQTKPNLLFLMPTVGQTDLSFAAFTIPAEENRAPVIWEVLTDAVYVRNMIRRGKTHQTDDAGHSFSKSRQLCS